MTDWLSDTAIATSCLILLVLLIRKPAARHFGAGVAYGLWILPAARLFMPSLTKEVAQPASTAIDPLAMAPMVETSGMAAIASSASTIDWQVPMLTLWLGGAALLFIIQMIRYCALRDRFLADAVELDQIDGIKVIESDEVSGPLAFGLFSRYIAVPKDFARIFAPRERELALAHELTHHRARDLHANLAAFIFLCLQWFNPLVWFAWSAFRFDQEAACDARVLAGADTATRQSYGRALARSANESMPRFAMALNSPHTIIERLRRLMMKDPSKGRRIAGRLAILAATAIALPLTATVVPVFAEDAPKVEEGKASVAEKHIRKLIIIKDGDGKPTTIDIKGDADTPFVKTIEKDGRTIVLRSNKELSEAEVDKMVAAAEKSRGEVEAALGEAEAARGEAEAAKGEAEAARAHADADRDHHISRVMSFTTSDDIDAKGSFPDINVAQRHSNCKDGQLVTANGFDGKDKATIAISICGKGNAKLARSEAITGLKEAQKQLKGDQDIPDNVRKSVLDSLQKQIDRLEKQLAEGKDDG
jgi:bla regulator protein blaR1